MPKAKAPATPERESEESVFTLEVAGETLEESEEQFSRKLRSLQSKIAKKPADTTEELPQRENRNKGTVRSMDELLTSYGQRKKTILSNDEPGKPKPVPSGAQELARELRKNQNRSPPKILNK